MQHSTLTGLKMLLDVSAFFLKTGVIDANFKQFGNIALLKVSLKYFALLAAKKPLLSFKNFTGRSASSIAFELRKLNCSRKLCIFFISLRIVPSRHLPVQS